MCGAEIAGSSKFARGDVRRNRTAQRKSAGGKTVDRFAELTRPATRPLIDSPYLTRIFSSTPEPRPFKIDINRSALAFSGDYVKFVEDASRIYRSIIARCEAELSGL
jgi:hypothetical protein